MKELVLYKRSDSERVCFTASGELVGDPADWSTSDEDQAKAWDRGRRILMGLAPFDLCTPRYRFTGGIHGELLSPPASRLIYWNTGLATTTIRSAGPGMSPVSEPAPALIHAKNIDRAPFFALPKKYADETVARVAWMSSEELVDVRTRPDPMSAFAWVVELECKRPQWALALHLFFWMRDPV